MNALGEIGGQGGLFQGCSPSYSWCSEKTTGCCQKKKKKIILEMNRKGQKKIDDVA